MSLCRVLLIEDSPDSAKLVNHFLGTSKIAEFQVVTAASLQFAREALARERFDAVLLDLNLPDSRGLETFAKVRDMAHGAAIVILTAVEDESVATAAIGYGAADYLIKGEVGGEGLARRIRFAIERSRATVAAAPEPPPPGRVTLLVGAKGGPGVSTMAVNLPRLLGATAGAPPAAGSWDASSAAALLQRIATMADHVIVDATLAQPVLAQAAAARSSFTLLVVEREPVSVLLAGRITGTLAAWSGRPTCVGAALVNHVPFLDSAPLPAIRAELNCGIVGVIPPARELLQSYRRQGPIVLTQPQAPVSIAFSELADRLDQSPVEFLNVG